ncbi:diguanylate cyclase [Robinsoniella sp. RHS]|uniref:sensor domain-containing diguanylate cyclase n=1 Tax=Robinsoniella sp. RHS TaxID=1504536 RepID=UPI00064A2FB4
MEKSTLIRTNIIICVIITLGFTITSIISYRSNIGIFQKDIENVSALASDGIYHKIDSIFAKPVNVSLTMANDSLLVDFLSKEKNHMEDDTYIQQLREYLNSYKEKYSYDSVFLVSTNTNRYYHFNGIDRLITVDNPENKWYYDFIEHENEYSLNVDNDEASDNIITIFVNCKIKAKDGSTLGVVGVGLKVDHLQELLKEYDRQFGVTARLIDHDGIIQVSSSETGYENVNIFKDSSLVDFKDTILQNTTGKETFWCDSPLNQSEYCVAQYIPNLKWHLVVANNSTAVSHQLHLQLGRNIAIIIFIIMCVLLTITKVIRKYNKQILKLSIDAELEYHKLLHEATEGLYENIYELDITHNCACGEGTKQYFESLGIDRDSPYDKALKTIAQKQVKEDYIQGYMAIFSPQHVLEVYKSGINTLTYDFLFLESPDKYRWMRINARIFYWASNQSIRMITYRQNIDAEKKREIMLLKKSQIDSLTGLYNKRTTEDMISGILYKDAPNRLRHAFIIFDIDNFKHINDTFGHTFGDSVITEFAAELRSQFRDSDIVGRIGGDEFAACMRDFHDIGSVIHKLERFCSKLSRKNFGKNSEYYISTSIGVSLFPDHGSSYTELYEKADQALYYTKGHGKGSYCIFNKNIEGDSVFHVNQQDMLALISTSIDGISKIAWVDGKFRMLYFNQKRTELTGSNAKTFSDPDYDVLSQIHPDDLPGALDIYYKSLPERVPFSLSYRLRHSDGHYIPVKANGLFVDEVYKEKYPVFYVIYTDMSSVLDFEKTNKITDKNL